MSNAEERAGDDPVKCDSDGIQCLKENSNPAFPSARVKLGEKQIKRCEKENAKIRKKARLKKRRKASDPAIKDIAELMSNGLRIISPDKPYNGQIESNKIHGDNQIKSTCCYDDSETVDGKQTMVTSIKDEGVERGEADAKITSSNVNEDSGDGFNEEGGENGHGSTTSNQIKSMCCYDVIETVDGKQKMVNENSEDVYGDHTSTLINEKGEIDAKIASSNVNEDSGDAFNEEEEQLESENCREAFEKKKVVEKKKSLDNCSEDDVNEDSEDIFEKKKVVENKKSLDKCSEDDVSEDSEDAFNEEESENSREALEKKKSLDKCGEDDVNEDSEDAFEKKKSHDKCGEDDVNEDSEDGVNEDSKDAFEKKKVVEKKKSHDKCSEDGVNEDSEDAFEKKKVVQNKKSLYKCSEDDVSEDSEDAFNEEESENSRETFEKKKVVEKKKSLDKCSEDNVNEDSEDDVHEDSEDAFKKKKSHDKCGEDNVNEDSEDAFEKKKVVQNKKSLYKCSEDDVSEDSEDAFNEEESENSRETFEKKKVVKKKKSHVKCSEDNVNEDSEVEINEDSQDAFEKKKVVENKKSLDKCGEDEQVKTSSSETSRNLKESKRMKKPVFFADSEVITKNKTESNKKKHLRSSLNLTEKTVSRIMLINDDSESTQDIPVKQTDTNSTSKDNLKKVFNTDSEDSQDAVIKHSRLTEKTGNRLMLINDNSESAQDIPEKLTDTNLTKLKKILKDSDDAVVKKTSESKKKKRTRSSLKSNEREETDDRLTLISDASESTQDIPEKPGTLSKKKPGKPRKKKPPVYYCTDSEDEKRESRKIKRSQSSLKSPKAKRFKDCSQQSKLNAFIQIKSTPGSIFQNSVPKDGRGRLKFSNNLYTSPRSSRKAKGKCEPVVNKEPSDEILILEDSEEKPIAEKCDLAPKTQKSSKPDPAEKITTKKGNRIKKPSTNATPTSSSSVDTPVIIENSPVEEKYTEIPTTPQRNAFQFMMNQRSKVIGSNSPGKAPPPEPPIEEKKDGKEKKEMLADRRKRFSEWNDGRGGIKRKLEADERAAYTDKVLESRANLMKEMLKVAEEVNDNVEKKLSTRRNDNVEKKLSTRKKKTLSEEINDDLDDAEEIKDNVEKKLSTRKKEEINDNVEKKLSTRKKKTLSEEINDDLDDAEAKEKLSTRKKRTPGNKRKRVLRLESTSESSGDSFAPKLDDSNPCKRARLDVSETIKEEPSKSDNSGKIRSFFSVLQNENKGTDKPPALKNKLYGKKSSNENNGIALKVKKFSLSLKESSNDALTDDEIDKPTVLTKFCRKKSSLSLNETSNDALTDDEIVEDGSKKKSTTDDEASRTSNFSAVFESTVKNNKSKRKKSIASTTDDETSRTRNSSVKSESIVKNNKSKHKMSIASTTDDDASRTSNSSVKSESTVKNNKSKRKKSTASTTDDEASRTSNFSAVFESTDKNNKSKRQKSIASITDDEASRTSNSSIKSESTVKNNKSKHKKMSIASTTDDESSRTSNSSIKSESTVKNNQSKRKKSAKKNGDLGLSNISFTTIKNKLLSKLNSPAKRVDGDDAEGTRRSARQKTVASYAEYDAESGQSRDKEVKVAPVFLKSAPKPKEDPAVVRARLDFLRSGVPSTLRKIAEKQQSIEDIDFDVFPSISHVQQRGPDPSNLWNLPSAQLNLAETENTALEHGLLSLGNVTTANAKLPSAVNLRPVTKDLKYKTILEDIKSKNPDYPVYKTFRLLSEKAGRSFAKPVETPTPVKRKRGRPRKKPVIDDDVVIVEEVPDKDANPADHAMWTEKYKPKSSDDIVGNHKSVTKLRDWLNGWIRFSKEIRMARRKRGRSDSSDFESTDGESRDCVKLPCNTMVLRGPVGSGKSVAVYAVCQELGVNVLEINASSKRTGKKLLQDMQEATQSHQVSKKDSLAMFLQKDRVPKEIREAKSEAENKMCVLLIEDADVVFEQDEGFISALSQLILTSKRPVVLLTSNVDCNHMQRFVSAYPVLNFTGLSAKTLAAWLQIVCLLEGLHVEKNSIGELLEWNGGDVRRTLLQLQFWVQTGGNDDASGTGSLYEKYCDVNASDDFIIKDDTSSSLINYEELESCASSDLQRDCIKPFVICDRRKFSLPFPVDLGLVWWNLPDLLNPKKKALPKLKKKEELAELQRACDVLDVLSFTDALYRAEGFDAELEPGGKRWDDGLKEGLSLKEDHVEYKTDRGLTREIGHGLLEGYCRLHNPDMGCCINMAVPVSSERRRRTKQRECEDEYLNTVQGSCYVHHSAFAVDYFPVLRTISRTESERARSNSKRGNRFYNYLRTLNINPSRSTMKTACNMMNARL